MNASGGGELQHLPVPLASKLSILGGRKAGIHSAISPSLAAVWGLCHPRGWQPHGGFRRLLLGDKADTGSQ